MTSLVLEELVLAKGGHSTRNDGVCLLEAVAWFAGEEHTAAPTCVSPVLRTFGIGLNDCLPDELRQTLIPFVPKIVGTTGQPNADQVRGWMAADWVVRVYTPTWLELGGFSGEAAILRGLPEVTGVQPLSEATEALLAVGRKPRAAGEAARAAAAEAVWDAAAEAVWDAAAEAAAEAVWDAAAEAATPRLAPTVEVLQQSAIELFGRMIDVTEPTPEGEAP